MFDRVPTMKDAPGSGLRWRPTTDQQQQQAALFGFKRRTVGKGEYRGLEFIEVESKSIINKVPGPPRFGFQYSINAYRGCSHACTYCFARPTHEYLNLNAAEDFEKKIVVKINAPDLARAETHPSRWSGDLIAMGTNTDPYQPAEGKYKLTRGLIEVLSERRNPFSILTKSPLVLRDVDLLVEAAGRTEVRVDFSIGTLDEEIWRISEPGTAHPGKRMDAVAALRRAGLRSGVLMGPILPGLSDDPGKIEEVVVAAVEADANFVSPVHLHLRPGVKTLYYNWLGEHRPDLLDQYERLYGSHTHAPAQAQERLTQTVAALVKKHGGRTISRRERKAQPPPPPTTQQLRLAV